MIRIFTHKDDNVRAEYITSEMVKHAYSGPDKKFIAIVPEQATLQMQQRTVRLHPAHSCMNIDIVSFDRLAHVVLAKLGRDELGIIDDTGKVLILKSVLKENAEDLTIYKNKANMLGFVSEMKSMITELKQYDIDDNKLFLMQEMALESGNGRLISKLADIRLIYNEFNRALKDKYTTQEEILSVFARSIPESDFFENCEIFFDGFTGFTPVQYKVIKGLVEAGIDLNIAVTIPEEAINKSCMEHELFYLSNETINRLHGIAADAGVGFEIINVGTGAEDKTLRLVKQACSSTSNEIETVATEILHLVRDNGYRYRDIGVLTADLEGYRKKISDMFAEADIPTFIDYKDTISGNVFVRYIFSMLDMIDSNMSYSSVFSFLKSGFTGINENEISILENYCLEFNIRGRRAWNKDFTRNRKLYGEDNFYYDIESINEIRQKVWNFTEALFETESGKSTGLVTARELSDILLNIVTSDSVDKKIEDVSQFLLEQGNTEAPDLYRQVYEKVIGLINQTSMLLGDMTISVKDYKEILKSGVDEIKVAVIPPTLDVVTIGDLTRTRLSDVKVLFVVGVNDGKIPKVSDNHGLFTQKERELLKNDFDIAPTSLEDIYTQRFYLYLCFNKPKDCLYLTWSAQGDKGEEMRASYVLDELDELLIRPVSEGDCRDSVAHHTWKKRALHNLAKQISIYVASKGETNVDPELMSFFAKAEPEVIRSLADSAYFTNRQTSLDERVALDLYGEKLKGSVSRIEKYYECPYKHFLSYGMNLKEREVYEIKVTDLGTIYHGALERYSRKLKAAGLNFRDINDEDSHKMADESVMEQIDSMDTDVLDSTARNEFLKERIMLITEKTTDVLRTHVKAGKFDPYKYEYRFVDENSYDKVTFNGVVDRVDLYDNGNDLFVKIIDYKSGSKKFSIADLENGTQLQLVAYLKETMDEMGRIHRDRNIRPAGVYYYLINDKYSKPEDQADKNKLSGVTLYESNIPMAVDSALEHGGESHIVNVKYKSDGMLHSASNAISQQEFTDMIDVLDKRITEAGDKILSGDVSVAPLEKQSCEYCDYKNICRFENGKYGTGYRNTDQQ